MTLSRAAVKFAIVGACAVTFFSAHVVVAAEQCCVYSVDKAQNPPAWLGSGGLGDSTYFLKTAPADGTCSAPKDTPQVALYANYYAEDLVDGKCANTTEAKYFKQDLANIQCCLLTDEAGKALACEDKEKTDTTNNCFALLQKTGKLTSSKLQIFKGTEPCSKIDKCVALKTPPTGAAATAAAANAIPKSDPLASNGANGRPVWTKDECEGIKNQKTSEAAYLWIPPKSDPSAQKGDFCFVRQLPTTLQVNIGQISVLNGLPQYINVVYKYAIGFSVIVMIVVIMFSGIQWMMSGVASSINDSRERIKNASLGLLLLFGANTILYTINPQLLNLKLPPMHAVRPDAFDVVKKGDEGVRCDPGDETACQAMGATFKCKPTGYYVGNKCEKQANALMGVVLGGAAIAVAGPFILGAGTATIAEQGAGQILKKVATNVAEEVATNAVTGSGTSGSDAASSAASSVGGVPGKVIVQGVALAVGMAEAYDIYDALTPTQGPANGYCKQILPEKPDFSVCQWDGECQSGACLITSSGACGAGKYGVCVSGKMSQICIIPKSYSFGLIDAFSNQDAVAKYGCKGTKCVDNGRGASKGGIGMCSDGSQIGYACDSNTPCKNLLNPLECIKGFCREKGYFNSQGVLLDTDFISHPRCMVATDCSDTNIGGLASFQKTIIAGCLKYPSKELGLPGRFLLPQLNAAIDERYYRELSTYGFCTTDRSYFLEYGDKTDASSNVSKVWSNRCFVNMYPSGGFVAQTKEVYDYLKSQSVFLPAWFDKGFSVGKVGCQKGSACRIKYSDFATDGVQSDKFVSVKGSCSYESLAGIVNSPYANVSVPEPKEGIALISNDPIQTKLKMIYVTSEDEKYNSIKMPNLIDLQYTFAGAPGS